MVIIVLVGAVALLKAARTNENGTGNLKAKMQSTPTKTNDKKASTIVIMMTLPMLFLISLILKNSPAVKAINAKAISLKKSVLSINSWGIKFKRLGPIRIPTRI